MESYFYNVLDTATPTIIVLVTAYLLSYLVKHLVDSLNLDNNFVEKYPVPWLFHVFRRILIVCMVVLFVVSAALNIPQKQYSGFDNQEYINQLNERNKELQTEPTNEISLKGLKKSDGTIAK